MPRINEVELAFRDWFNAATEGGGYCEHLHARVTYLFHELKHDCSQESELITLGGKLYATADRHPHLADAIFKIMSAFKLQSST